MKKTVLLLFIPIFFFTLVPLSKGQIAMTPSATRRTFAFVLNPGESKKDSIVVKNMKDYPITIHLYGADATYTAQGTLAVKTPDDEQRLIGKWVTFEEPFITLKPNEDREIPFIIKTPKKTPPGIYAGGIAASTIPGAAVGGQNTTTAGSSIQIVARIIVQTYVQVPGEKIHKFKWPDFTHGTEINGKKSFQLTFKNEGNTIITTKSTIEISGFPKQYNSKITPADNKILGGDTLKVKETWPLLPKFGFFRASAKVTAYEYDIINNQDKNPETFIKEVRFYIIPFAIFVWLILILLFLIALYVTFKILRKAYIKKCEPYIVQSNETLTSIAEKYGISWKKLASINKLKPPYSIKPGQQILIPPQKTFLQK